MFLKRNVEIVAERFYPLVTLTNPLGAEFTDQVGASKFVRENAATDAIASFENGNIPTSVLKFVRGGEAGESRTDDDA